MKFSIEKEQKIIQMYKNGKSQKDIASYFNTFNTSIRRVLLRNNIKIRSGEKVLRIVKHNPFKRNDRISNYFLGLLITDGCITKEKKNKNYKIDLQLSEKDKDIIYKYRDWISPNLLINKFYQKINGTYMYGVAYKNMETVEWLNKKANFHNKSFNAKLYIPITWDILRGIFDGDGYFVKSNKFGLRFGICSCSKILIDQINYFLNKHNIKTHIHVDTKHRKNIIYYIQVYKIKDVIKIGENMYNNTSYFIKRKYEKWLSFYESRKQTPLKFRESNGKPTLSEALFKERAETIIEEPKQFNIAWLRDSPTMSNSARK